MLTGVGGLGVQLGAQVLARAATLEGRQVMFFGVYGGTMRGGNTDATVVVADEAIQAPPLISRTWSALAMHHQYWSALEPKLRPQAVVLLNSSLFEADLDRDAYRVFDVPASKLATELGNVLAASMVMIGAYASVTDMVGIESLAEAMQQSVPSYRQQHVKTNVEALRAGFDLAPRGAAPAWEASG